MEACLFPNPRRPGIGLRPHREGQRPLLPQHARHCPVLEAGSALGLMVHPPLNENESYHIGYEGEGRYRFVYSVNPTGAKWEAIFVVAFLLPVGGMGAATEEVTMLIPATPESRETALLMAGMFIVADDLGTPAGAVTLRGAWNFQTPPGWDTVSRPGIQPSLSAHEPRAERDFRTARCRRHRPRRNSSSGCGRTADTLLE